MFVSIAASPEPDASRLQSCAERAMLNPVRSGTTADESETGALPPINRVATTGEPGSPQRHRVRGRPNPYRQRSIRGLEARPRAATQPRCSGRGGRYGGGRWTAPGRRPGGCLPGLRTRAVRSTPQERPPRPEPRPRSRPSEAGCALYPTCARRRSSRFLTSATCGCSAGSAFAHSSTNRP